MATAFLVSGCQVGTQPPQTAAIAPTVDLRQKEIEERKDDDGKTREYMAAGSFKDEAPEHSDEE